MGKTDRIRIETLGLDILKCLGFCPDISDPSNLDSVSNWFDVYEYHKSNP